MGNTDEGYTRVSNEILDAMLGYGFTQTQLVILLYVLRKTVGWNKPSDHIAISKLARDTGKRRQLISRVVADLEKMGVLSVTRISNGRAPEISLNKPSEWDKPATVELHETAELHETKKSKTCNRRVAGGATVGLQQPATPELHTKEKKYTIQNTEQKKGPSAPISQEDDDLNNTMFNGKITVREWRMLSEAEQVAMYEAEGYT